MAIDTAAKRRSAAGVPFLPLGPGVSPDSDKDAFWRQCAGWGYGGIAAASPTTAVGAVYVTFETRQLSAQLTPREITTQFTPRRVRTQFTPRP
jgi:hypothetical protein